MAVGVKFQAYSYRYQSMDYAKYKIPTLLLGSLLIVGGCGGLPLGDLLVPKQDGSCTKDWQYPRDDESIPYSACTEYIQIPESNMDSVKKRCRRGRFSQNKCPREGVVATCNGENSAGAYGRFIYGAITADEANKICSFSLYTMKDNRDG